MYCTLVFGKISRVLLGPLETEHHFFSTFIESVIPLFIHTKLQANSQPFH